MSVSACPFDANRDDRKSARLAAERLRPDPDARLVGGFAFGREILRSGAMKQAADIGGDRFDLSDPATTPVIFLDGEPHRRKRSAIAKFFTPKAVSTQYRPVMERVTDALLRGMQASGGGQLDVVSFELAVTVAAEIVGLTNSDGAAMSRRIATAFASGTKRRRNGLERAVGGAAFALKTLDFYYRDVRPAIRARRETRREDVISQLLDQKASDKAILTECMVYASAGMVTTREFIVMAAWHLFEHQHLRERFIDGGEAAQLAILDEILRLEPVAGLLYRRATEDIPGTEGGDVAAGALLIIDVRAANGDPAATGACPYQVDPDRSRQAKGAGSFLSFGDGPHRCPGAQVALHETRVFLDGLMRLPGVRLVGEPVMSWNDALMSYELRGATIACDR